MNLLAHKVLKAIGAGIGVKSVPNFGNWVDNSALSGNLFSSGRTGFLDQSPGTQVNYHRLAGELWQNSAIQACLNWIIRAWPESYPCVKQPGDGGKKLIVSHPLTDILMNPNDWDDDTTLWAGTILSFWCDGNAYWYIQRDRGGRVAQFDYVPHWACMPHRDIDSTSAGPDYYRLRQMNGYRDVDPSDIVHYRFGRDPYNDLLGMAPWASVNREVYTDNEACNYTATTLRKGGKAWMIVSPAARDEGFEDPVATRELIEARTTGDNRGGVLVLDVATKVDFPGPMKDMGVESLRQIPVHRICAMAGISVDSLDLGNANDHVTFQNQVAADAKSWNTLVCVQRMMGRQLTKQVLWNPRNFNVRPNSLFAGFDYSEVRALQAVKFQKWDTVRNQFDAHLLTDDEARAEMGYDPFTPEQRTAIAAQIAAETPAVAEPAPVPVPRATASGNGTGKAHVDPDLTGVLTEAGIGALLRKQLAARIEA